MCERKHFDANRGKNTNSKLKKTRDVSISYTHNAGGTGCNMPQPLSQCFLSLSTISVQLKDPKMDNLNSYQAVALQKC